MSSSLVSQINQMFVTRNDGIYVLKDVMCELHMMWKGITWQEVRICQEWALE